MTQIYSNSLELINGNQLNNDLQFLFCGLFQKSLLKSFDLKSLVLSQNNSRLLTANELEIVLKELDANIYEVNCNRSIFSLKSTGKPFFIDKSPYNYDYNIYLHHTDFENIRLDLRANEELMYTLMVLFSEEIPEFNRQELSNILKLIPNDCYDVNCNQTIYSLKINGKRFFTDKSFKDLNLYVSNSKSDKVWKGIPLDSQTLGRKFAEQTREVLMSFKNYEKDLNRRSMEKLEYFGHRKAGNAWFPENSSNPNIYLYRKRFISQNGNYDNPKDVKPTKDKWGQTLARRKVYNRSEFMIRASHQRLSNRMLNVCKESLYDRTQRQNMVRKEAIIKTSVNCNVLKQRLFTIYE